MDADFLHQCIPLPELSDKSAVEIHNFLEVAIDLFEARYGYQIERYYDSLSQHNIIQRRPQTSTDDPPF